jgi:hypothetical protein
MPKLLFTVLCIAISFVSFGQDYIVTLRSDTVKGEVKLLSYDLMDRLQLAEGKKKTTYTALQVRRASINGEQFAPVKLDNSIRMMKVLRTGFMSLYGHRVQGQSNFDTRILQKIGSATIEVPNIGFKKFVGALVEDCPLVSDRIKSGDFNRNNVDAMVDEYNACIADLNQKRMETTTVKTPATDVVEEMRSKVNASDIANKSEVNDLLNSIAEKVKKKETVPAYMKDGLKGYIGEREDLKADMEKLFTLIDQ